MWAAGVGSVLPAWSVLYARKVCSPTARRVYSWGEAHSTYGAPSSEHANIAPASVEESVKEADAPVVVACSVVSGGAVSTVQLLTAGVGSVLPAASRERTRNV